jgi:glycosyltransferase involved in cell wall biosynthesis
VQPTITVVIAACNAARTLGAQLEALRAQCYAGEWDVVVVDNKSTDGTADVARSYAAGLRLEVVAAPERPSAAYARNVGIGASVGDLLVFLDADDVASPELLESYAASAGRFDVMGGHLDEGGLNDPEIAFWRYPLTTGGLPVAFGRFPYFVGANCAVRRRVFEQIGMFDPMLEFVGEEVDFSIRAGIAGYEVGWVPEAVVHYRHRTSLRALARQSYVYGRGAVVLFKRYRGFAEPPNRLAASAHRAALLTFRLPDLIRSRARRGRWIMLASATTGQIVECFRQRVWFVG